MQFYVHGTKQVVRFYDLAKQRGELRALRIAGLVADGAPTTMDLY